MTKNMDDKRRALIKEISLLTSESEIEGIQKYLKVLKLNKDHGNIFNGIRKTISVEQLKKEQNYKGIDRTEFDKLVEELDIQEPIEQLLSMLD